MLPINLKLNDEFYKEEYRDGYLVTKEVKELWAVELDLLVKFDEVCKKHNIKYYLFGGTLLGAARHKGFIPWDDDIDVVIFREDYDKLISIASEEFEQPYLLQSAYTDKNYMRGHVQLRNIETCMMLPSEAKIVEFNQGIFIDIFVFDGLVDDKDKLKVQLDKMNDLKRKMKYITYRNSLNPIKAFLKRLRAKYIECVYGDVKSLYNKFSKIAQMYNDRENVEILMFRNSMEECVRHKRNWYEDIAYVSFEGIEFPVPKCCDEILKLCYGVDYMIPQKVPTTHGALIVSTEKSYHEIVKII